MANIIKRILLPLIFCGIICVGTTALLTKYVPTIPLLKMQKANAAFSSWRMITAAAGATDDFISDNTSYAFDGTADLLKISDHADWAFGTNDLTIEIFVRFNTLAPNSQTLATQITDGSNTWFFRFQNDVGIRFFSEIAGAQTINVQQGSTSGWSIDTWYHIAVRRSGDNWNIYRDAISIASATQTNPVHNATTDLEIGARTGGDALNGRVDEVRISNVARTITVPTTEFTSDGNTLLLIHGSETIISGTTGSLATFNDSGNTTHLVTEVDNAIRDTVIFK